MTQPAIVLHDDGVHRIEWCPSDKRIRTYLHGQYRGAILIMDMQEIQDLFDEDPQSEHENTELAAQRG